MHTNYLYLFFNKLRRYDLHKAVTNRCSYYEAGA